MNKRMWKTLRTIVALDLQEVNYITNRSMIYIASRAPSIEFSILRKPKLLRKIVFTGDTMIGTNQSGAQIYMDY